MNSKKPSTHPLRNRVRQAKEKTADRLHHLEDKAVDTYHVIEDHNAAELRQDVFGLLAQLRIWAIARLANFKAWYARQPGYLRIVYGVTVVPVVALLAFGGFLLIKFGGPILLALLLAAKLGIALSKMVLFVGYIGYKIVKTLLMWYITLTRWYLGAKAKRIRRSCAERCDFSVQPPELSDKLSFRCEHKDLYVQHQDFGQVRILFSYLRYALIGQRVLLRHILNSWLNYLTLWRQHSRHKIKNELAPVGTSLFSPHKLGADVTPERVLVPGDAELLQLSGLADDVLELTFQICWVEWYFEFRKALKFLHISRDHQSTTWQVEVSFQPLTNASSAQLSGRP